MDLPEWIDLDGRLAGLQELPIVLQLRPVNLRPSLDEALLRLRQAAVQAFKRVDGEDSRVLLVERVKVCAVVLPTGCRDSLALDCPSVFGPARTTRSRGAILLTRPVPSTAIGAGSCKDRSLPEP